ncbi:MAG: phosphoglycerate dehydrogenase [Phycisphaerae bacterium]|nr:phosphoglycerate dehydrogenase [Phycisphaerae bacterium]
MDKILVTPRSITKNGHPALKMLEEAGYEIVFSTPGVQPDENELISLLPDCIGYLAGVEKISAKTLLSAKQLKVIARNGVGIDNIDLKKAKQLGIEICPAVGSNARSVAELTIGLIFSLVRSIPFTDKSLKNGQWERKKGIELQGRTLGLIGCGNIGKHVANMALGIGMKVVAFDTFADLQFKPAARFQYVDMEQLLQQSDIISLHCPMDAKNEALINRQTIEKMKAGVYLVNTARAALLDDQAVFDALETGRIAGLATDVYRQEPPVCRTLVEHNRVISTSHIGAFTEESISRAVEQAVKEILSYLKSSSK